MAVPIKIREFKGVFTNADREDIPKGYLTVLKNLKNYNGKLIKTFGFGSKIATALSTSPKNIFTFIHSQLENGYLYIAVQIDDTTKVVTIKAWDGSAWQDIEDISGFQNSLPTVYHKASRNPIIQDGETLRILPGNVAEADGTNESKGIWIGYIDYKLFDEIYEPTAGFYIYENEITKPEIDITLTLDGIGGDGTNHDVFGSTDTYRYYKVSYIYDGVQESLLSDVLGINILVDTFPRFDLSITKANHNNRITGLKLYRSTTFSEKDEDNPFYHILTIDFLRESGKIFSGTGAQWNTLYVPDLITYSFVDDGRNYRIVVDGTNHGIYTPSGGGTGHDNFITGATIDAEYWAKDWILEDDAAGGGVWTERARGYGGCYGGKRCCYLGTDLGIGNLSGSVLMYYDNDGSKDIWKYIHINMNYKKMVLCSADDTDIIDESDRDWKVIPLEEGLYRIVDNGDDVNITFFDTNIGNGSPYSLLDEKSTKINGKFGVVIGDRLWQGNIVLAPEDEKEEHIDWISYSEIQQLDVNPVSNIIKVTDREGGAITGIAEIMGNPVILKEYGIIKYNIRSNPSSPANWSRSESPHNIGNIAEFGYISVMDVLYVCYWDGIYQLRANNLAETDETPTEKLRISEPINDLYLNLTKTQKQNITAQYDQYKSEIIFTLGDEVWAFNILEETWRMIDTNVTLTFMTLDESANILVYDDIDKKFYYKIYLGNI